MEFLKQNKKPIAIFMLVIILFIMSTIVLNKETTSEYKKNIDNLDYVYTQNSTKPTEFTTKSEMPYINLEGPEIKKINEEIVSLYYNKVSTDDNHVNYKYNIKGRIMSMLITVLTGPDGGDHPNTTYISYNIDMEKRTLISNDLIMSINNITKEKIEKSIYNKMKLYYEFEKNKGYINQLDCDFNCYLIERNININDLTNIAIYIDKDNKFKIYKTYQLSYDFVSDEDADIEPFEFVIER